MKLEERTFGTPSISSSANGSIPFTLKSPKKSHFRKEMIKSIFIDILLFDDSCIEVSRPLKRFSDIMKLLL